MTLSDDESELQRANREADEAEARLRRMKESLMPRDRADAVTQLVRAEVVSMFELVSAKYHGKLVGLETEEQAMAVLEELQQELLAGLDRAKAATVEQMKAWTLAALEDRALEAEDN